MSFYAPQASHVSFTRSVPVHRAASTYGGAGGHGTRISSVSSMSLRSTPRSGGISSSTAFNVSSAGMGAGAAGSLRASTASTGHILGNEKGQMQNLNDRLATYLETVRRLEQENSKLEMQIRGALEKGGPETRDYSKYNAILDDLRRKVFDVTSDNARLVLQIDNARLAVDDFRVKFENEMAIRQSVEGDIAGLKKVIDDTNVGRLNVEGEIESLKDELLFLKKNHENEVGEMRNQITQSGVQVDVDAPKGQDLSQVMEEIRANYEKMALKNAEELKMWHESQISEVQGQVAQNTEALQGAQMEMNDLRRQVQTLEIELASQQSLKASLEDTLRNTELRSNAEVEKYNTITLQLEAELSQLRSNITEQGQEYEALLNIKMKLEAEINTYKKLLDGEDFELQDALDGRE
ncbi:keratin, type I cytoskeletal 18-like [Sinocyclocheilus rhinocerous]|uniref:Keratin, type I cytoskeletal 18-like n=1 Tax=Sinocyclocheilus rhinocerous TaxID=307959 RepID=A0A673I5D5_9TELE|nr:PREDICTED: keratin, type I cytoskeletal 18-like [Sinocyclocheilus rhinocerous]